MEYAREMAKSIMNMGGAAWDVLAEFYTDRSAGMHPF